MRPSDLSSQPSHRPLFRRLRDEEGYVVALTALLILPILAFVAMGVDLGAWYARAQQLQRTADAAALAAAPLTPDTVAARAAALAALAKNGVDCSSGPVSCTLEAPTGSDIAYRVTLTDPSVIQFFSTPFRDSVSITRTATAERLRPIPMGSPTNYLGTNELIATGGSNPPRENFWLAESGKCASKEQGDRRMPITDANWTGAWDAGGDYRSCNDANTVANTEHDPEGYTYVMNLAEDFTGTVHLEVYDPTLCSAGPSENPTGSGGSRFQLRYRVLGLGSSPGAAPWLSDWTPSNTDTACNNYANRWVTIWRFTNPTEGAYYLQIADPSGAGVTTNRNSNQFAIRARYDGTTTSQGATAPTSWAKCSTIAGSTTPTYRADCPQVYAYQDLGVYAGVSGGSAEFFLASINSDYNGRELEVTLWDPGEGSNTIQLLNPVGNPVTFDWESLDCATGVTPPTGGCTGTGSSLNVSGTGAQPGPFRFSTSRYSDRPIRLSFTLPDDIDTTYGGRTWWKVRYTASNDVHDRTTWTVRVAGDPVRLVSTIS